MLVRSKIYLSPGDGEYAPAAQDEDAVADEDESEEEDDVGAIEPESNARGRHQRRSLSRHEIEEARQTSIARLSFSQAD